MTTTATDQTKLTLNAGEPRQAYNSRLRFGAADGRAGLFSTAS